MHPEQTTFNVETVSCTMLMEQGDITTLSDIFFSGVFHGNTIPLYNALLVVVVGSSALNIFIRRKQIFWNLHLLYVRRITIPISIRILRRNINTRRLNRHALLFDFNNIASVVKSDSVERTRVSLRN